MTMMGGLDCIAMAVEHLERSERRSSESSPTGAGGAAGVGNAPPPTPTTVSSTREGPVSASPPTTHSLPAVLHHHQHHHQYLPPPLPHHCFYQMMGGAPPMASYHAHHGQQQHPHPPPPAPHASSFVHQPRAVTTETTTAAAAAAAAVDARGAHPAAAPLLPAGTPVKELRRQVSHAQSLSATGSDGEETAAPSPAGATGVDAASQQPQLGCDDEATTMSPDDAKHIEELRRLIFQIDLSEWKSLPHPDEKEVITKVTDVDVLSGRGGETNHHKGNITFRACVKACQPAYIEAKRREKPYIAQRIVLFIHHLGGRFLKREGESIAGDGWRSVQPQKAREKTSQALREGAPELRGDVKEVVSTSTSAAAAPSHEAAPMSFVHDPYYKYGGGPVPKMVTVSSRYAALAAPAWHPQGLQMDLVVTRRPSKKQKRRESHYAKAAEDVLSHPSVVSTVSEGSLTMLHHDPSCQPAIPPSPVRGTEYPMDATSMTTPGTPRVTISSDEEERSRSSSSSSHVRPITMGSAPSEQQQSPNSVVGAGTAAAAATAIPSSVVVAHSGPRLKLLKKRILSTGSS